MDNSPVREMPVVDPVSDLVPVVEPFGSTVVAAVGRQVIGLNPKLLEDLVDVSLRHVCRVPQQFDRVGLTQSASSCTCVVRLAKLHDEAAMGDMLHDVGVGEPVVTPLRSHTSELIYLILALPL